MLVVVIDGAGGRGKRVAPGGGGGTVGEGLDGGGVGLGLEVLVGVGALLVAHGWWVGWVYYYNLSGRIDLEGWNGGDGS